MVNLNAPNAQIGIGFQPFVGECTNGRDHLGADILSMTSKSY